MSNTELDQSTATTTDSNLSSNSRSLRELTVYEFIDIAINNTDTDIVTEFFDLIKSETSNSRLHNIKKLLKLENKINIVNQLLETWAITGETKLLDSAKRIYNLPTSVPIELLEGGLKADFVILENVKAALQTESNNSIDYAYFVELMIMVEKNIGIKIIERETSAFQFGILINKAINIK